MLQKQQFRALQNTIPNISAFLKILNFNRCHHRCANLNGTDEPSQYCLDYTIDYCSGETTTTIRAIINDKDYKQSFSTTIFGTGKEDSAASRRLKWVGYSISIFFLILTLLFFIIDADLRKVVYFCFVAS